jgi:hypothetical protein
MLIDAIVVSITAPVQLRSGAGQIIRVGLSS